MYIGSLGSLSSASSLLKMRQNYTLLEQKGWFLIFLSIVDKNINLTTICFWSKNQLVLMKISNLRKMSIWTKNQIWQNSQIWQKCQIWQKMSTFPPPPPPPPILWMWYLIFFWTKKKFWQTKREQTLPWNSNSSDLDAELATSAASRWNHFMLRHQYPLVYPIPSHPNTADGS